MVSRHRGSKDGNHDDIAQALRDLGCSVLDAHQCGIPNFPDIIAGLLGRTVIIEVKNPATHYGRAGLTAGQSAFARDWRGGQVYVVTSRDEAIALVQNLRRAAQ